MKRQRQTNPSSGETDRTEKISKCEIHLTNRIYFTKIEGHPARFSKDALSLSELLEAIKPTDSIHFNFMVDLQWLISQYPLDDNLSMKFSIIVGDNGDEYKELTSDIQRRKLKGISVGRARLPIPFGTHHSKLSIFKNSDSRIHLIISTANLLENDWISKTQAFFHCSGTLKISGEEVEKDDFGEDLASYLSAYSNSRDWHLIEPWYILIKDTDFSHIKAKLIFSVPGSHKGQDMNKYGHMKMRKLLMNVTTDPKNTNFYAQFSSIGSLGAKPDLWLSGEFLTSLAGGSKRANQDLKLIFPCVEDVRNSVEGYMAGSSLPYQKRIALKQSYLRSYMHKWRSEKHGRTRAMPHIKSYCAITKDSLHPIWLIITSANLSKAAWGQLQKNENQLMIRSYEVGVLLSDEDSLDILPYDVPLSKYDEKDEIWLCDGVYNSPDTYGLSWPFM